MKAKHVQALDELAGEVYQIAADHGFHQGETIGFVDLNRLAVFIANLHGECSELWEAGRKGILHVGCDKDCNITNLEEELADIAIRLLDTAHAHRISIGNAIRKKSEYNKSRPFMHGKKA